jgi:hypothetical protein
MLIKPLTESPAPPRSPRRERRLWHDESRNSSSIGCSACPELSICGGLRVEAALFDCLNYCCGNIATCSRVCRNHPDFPDRVREIAGFSLEGVPRVPGVPAIALPPVVPLIFHGKRRRRALDHDVAALPLYSMIDRQGGPKFATHEGLCQEYRLRTGTRLVLTGTHRDAPIERWWGLGEQKRRALIASLSRIGVAVVTTPNYSIFSDIPRWDNLHAMKRIALVAGEFLAEGVQVALHVNGRTDMDFERWSEFVSQRTEVRILAYEFTTGTGWPGRREQHAIWLSQLARAASRPLDLIVRGGAEVLPSLEDTFARVTVLDSTAFMKTMKRQRAVRANGRVRWEASPTPPGQPLDDLLADNVSAVMGVSEQDLVQTR